MSGPIVRRYGLPNRWSIRSERLLQTLWRYSVMHIIIESNYVIRIPLALPFGNMPRGWPVRSSPEQPRVNPTAAARNGTKASVGVERRN